MRTPLSSAAGGHRPRPRALSTAVCLFLVLASSAFAQSLVEDGELAPGDARLGKYFDTFPVDLSSGTRVKTELTSQDFDAYLILESPDGTEHENDDGGGGTDALIDLITDVGGTWKIKATSAGDGETGTYQLSVTTEYVGTPESFSGSLERGDSMSLKGEYYDSYRIEPGLNRRVIVSLQSEDFDSFLVVQPPAGIPMMNDDSGSESESRVEFFAAEQGVYTVNVTSFEGMETGAYTLRVYTGNEALVERYRETLGDDDPTFEAYGYTHTYTVELPDGADVIFELVTQDFDPVLTVELPDGSTEENDDFEDLTTISKLKFSAITGGTYTVHASAYEQGPTGEYTLSIYTIPALPR